MMAAEGMQVRMYMAFILGLALATSSFHEANACSRRGINCTPPTPKPIVDGPKIKQPEGNSSTGLRSGGTSSAGSSTAAGQANGAVRIDPNSVRRPSQGAQPPASIYRASPFPKHRAVTRDYRKSHNPYQLGRVDTENRNVIVTVNDVDVSETVQRAHKGAGRYGGDGTPYKNGGEMLPAGTYTRWTHPTPGLTDAGGQRIVIEKLSGSVYYSPDHYKTFWILK